jgi:AraC family transcriptional regulator of arabinose operon
LTIGCPLLIVCAILLIFSSVNGEFTMINISGYVSDADEDMVEEKNIISVNSCGYYRLVKQTSFETNRPAGRSDYQLLYVAAGSARFKIDGKIQVVEEGYLVIFGPCEPQYYIYYLSDNPEVYWLHFSGAEIDIYLKSLGFNHGAVFKVGVKNEYIPIFEKIIKELQVKRSYFFELSNLYALELLSLMSRNMTENSFNLSHIGEQLQYVIKLIHKNSNEKHIVTEYAKLCSMSTCWFIHCFKQYTGKTPQQYITDIRIAKAKELLSYSSYNITEISLIVGYDNPFYFSRIFKKNTDHSPREYRNRLDT